jgi:hypothetical protein
MRNAFNASIKVHDFTKRARKLLRRCALVYADLDARITAHWQEAMQRKPEFTEVANRKRDHCVVRVVSAKCLMELRRERKTITGAGRPHDWREFFYGYRSVGNREQRTQRNR